MATVSSGTLTMGNNMTGSCSATVTRSGVNLSVSWTLKQNLNSSSTWIGSGYWVDVTVTTNRGGSQNKDVKTSSGATWEGTATRTTTGSFTVSNVPSVTSFTVKFVGDSNLSSGGQFSWTSSSTSISAATSTTSTTPNFTLGGNVTASITRNVSSYTHDVALQLLNADGTWSNVASLTGLTGNAVFNSTNYPSFYANCAIRLAQRSSCKARIRVITKDSGGTSLGTTYSSEGTCTSIAASTVDTATWTAGSNYTSNITRANTTTYHLVEFTVNGSALGVSCSGADSIANNSTNFHYNTYSKMNRATSSATSLKCTTYWGGSGNMTSDRIIRSATTKTGTVTAQSPIKGNPVSSSYNIGETVTINMANKVSNIVYTIMIGDKNSRRWALESGGTWTYNSGSGGYRNTTSETFALFGGSGTATDPVRKSIFYITAGDALYIPNNSQSGSMSIYVNSYYQDGNNYASIGSEQVTSVGIKTVAADAAPTLSGVTLSDSAGFSGICGVNGVIQNKSALRMALTVTAAPYPSDITTRTASIANHSGSASWANNYLTFGTFSAISGNAINTQKLTVTVGDRRGYTSSYSSHNITMFPYSKPVVSTFSVKRSDTISSQVIINLKGTKSYIYNANSGNQNDTNPVTITYTVQRSGASVEGPYNLTFTKANTTFDSTNVVSSYNFSEDYSYTITFTIKDAVGESETRSIIILPITPLLALRRERVGINTIPATNYALDVNGDVRIQTKLNGTNRNTLIVSTSDITFNGTTLKNPAIATQAQAQAATDNVTMMTPLKVQEWAWATALPFTADTLANWQSLKSKNYIASNMGLANQPATYGLIKVTNNGYTEGSAIWYTQSSGAIYRKSWNGTTISGWVRIDYELSRVYPIGAIYVGSSSTNPGSTLGGTWKLVYKKCQEREGSNGFTATSALSAATGNWHLRSNSLILMLNMQNAAEWADTTISCGNVNFSGIGITRLATTVYPTGSSDGNNAVAQFYISYGGVVEMRDATLGRNNPVAAGASFYIEVTYPISWEWLNDSICDEWHWKRTA